MLYLKLSQIRSKKTFMQSSIHTIQECRECEDAIRDFKEKELDKVKANESSIF